MEDWQQVDFIASERHFADHLACIYHALPAERRGIFWLREDVLHEAKRLRLQGRPFNKRNVTTILGERRGLVVCAASRDLGYATRGGRDSVYCEHGAGQTYSNNHASYAGGNGRHFVKLMLVPGEHPAKVNRKRYSHIPVNAIGCPKLDAYHKRSYPRSATPVVAISFHWDCFVAPETRSSWSEFKPLLKELAAQKDFQVLGHGHPRIYDLVTKEYRKLGIECVRDFSEVLKRADIYVCDNSSTIFEFASTDRPVVVLNSHHYRKDVQHGLRFWDCADVGIQVESPKQSSATELLSAIRRAIKDPPEVASNRREAVSRVYAHTDGLASHRAAQAIMEVINDMPELEKKKAGAPKGGRRMKVTRSYQGHEGNCFLNDIVYPGYRRQGGEWVRLPHVDPEQRAKQLMAAKNATPAPLEAQAEEKKEEPGTEDKRAQPGRENKSKPAAKPEREKGELDKEDPTARVQCPDCDKDFASLRTLRTHRKRYHPEKVAAKA